MAIVKKRIINTDNISAIKNFIDSFNSPIVTASIVDTTHSARGGKDLVLTFEDKGTVTLYPNGSSIATYAAYNFPDISSDGRYIVSSGEYPITICSSDTFFYFEFSFVSWGDYCTFIFVYDKVSENSTLFGIDGFYPHLHHSIIDTNLTVTELESGANFTYGRPLNYSVTIGTIQYLDHTIILNGAVKAFNNNVLRSCTQVAPGVVITFNGQNYYAIGNNTLIPMEVQT